MIKKKVLIVFNCLLILLILFLALYSYKSSSEYKQITLPEVKADSIKSLVIELIQRQEYFVGSVHVKFLDIAHSSDLDKAEITIINESSGGDSLGTTEYKIFAEKRDQVWITTEYKIHWKCGRDFPSIFWTTKACS